MASRSLSAVLVVFIIYTFCCQGNSAPAPGLSWKRESEGPPDYQFQPSDPGNIVEENNGGGIVTEEPKLEGGLLVEPGKVLSYAEEPNNGEEGIENLTGNENKATSSISHEVPKPSLTDEKENSVLEKQKTLNNKIGEDPATASKETVKTSIEERTNGSEHNQIPNEGRNKVNNELEEEKETSEGLKSENEMDGGETSKTSPKEDKGGEISNESENGENIEVDSEKDKPLEESKFESEKENKGVATKNSEKVGEKLPIEPSFNTNTAANGSKVESVVPLEKDITVGPQKSTGHMPGPTTTSTSEDSGRMTTKRFPTTRSTSEGEKVSWAGNYGQKATSSFPGYQHFPNYFSRPYTQRLPGAGPQYTSPEEPHPSLSTIYANRKFTHPSQYNPIYTGNYGLARTKTTNEQITSASHATTAQDEIATTKSEINATSTQISETSQGQSEVSSTTSAPEKTSTAQEEVVETTSSLSTTTETPNVEPTTTHSEVMTTTSPLVLSETTTSSKDELEVTTTTKEGNKANESTTIAEGDHHNRKRPPVNYGREGVTPKPHETPEKEQTTKSTSLTPIATAGTASSPMLLSTEQTGILTSVKNFGDGLMKRFGALKVSLVLLAIVALLFVAIICCCKLCKRKGYKIHQRRLKEYGQEKEFLLRNRNKGNKYGNDTVTLLEGSSEDEF